MAGIECSRTACTQRFESGSQAEYHSHMQDHAKNGAYFDLGLAFHGKYTTENPLTMSWALTAAHRALEVFGYQQDSAGTLFKKAQNPTARHAMEASLTDEVQRILKDFGVGNGHEDLGISIESASVAPNMLQPAQQTKINCPGRS